MTQFTPKAGIPYPEADTDDVRDYPDVAQSAAETIEDTFPIALQGVIASRPVSTVGSPGIQNRRYFATDEGIEYVDTGTSWIAVAAKDGLAAAATQRTLGTGSTQAAAGNDSRLSDNRTPLDASVTTAKLASGLIVPVAKGGTGATDASGARTNLGATTVGGAVFTAASESAGRSALGGTAAGGALFTAADDKAQRVALGNDHPSIKIKPNTDYSYSGTAQTLTFGTTVERVGVDADITPGTTGVVILRAGLYLVIGTCMWVSNSTGTRTLFIYYGAGVTPNTAVIQTKHSASSDGDTALSVSSIVKCNANDQLTLWQAHSVGGSLTVDDAWTRLSVVRLGGNSV